MLITSVQSPEVAARWNNNVQALVEGAGLGIPANNSSDPRHGTSSGVEYTAGAGGKISQWPDQLGLAATFDPAVVQGVRAYRRTGIQGIGYRHGIVAADRFGFGTALGTH